MGGVAFSLTDFPTVYLRVEQGTPWSGDQGLWEGLPPWDGVEIQWLLSLDSMVSVPLCRCTHGVLLKLYSKKERETGCLCRAVHGQDGGKDAIILRGPQRRDGISQLST